MTARKLILIVVNQRGRRGCPGQCQQRTMADGRRMLRVSLPHEACEPSKQGQWAHCTPPGQTAWHVIYPVKQFSNRGQGGLRHLFSQVPQGVAENPGYVHLRNTNLCGNLALGHSLEKPELKHGSLSQG